MKKTVSLILTCLLALALAACGAAIGSGVVDGTGADSPQNSTAITVTTRNSSAQTVEIEVPYNPQRLAVMDLAALDVLDNLGVGDRVVGVSKGTSIAYLQGYTTDDAIRNLGTIKEADLEAVMECQPDLIFIGGRLSAKYDALSQIAPVISIATDVQVGVVESTRENAMNIASIFGLEAMASGLLADYDERIANLAAVAQGNNAVVGMVNAGGFGVLGNDGRCSIIGVEIGFENIGLAAAAAAGSDGGGERNGGEAAAKRSEEPPIDGAAIDGAATAGQIATTATHGNEASFEVLVSLNPDYIFIMDRDAAINTEGAQLAQEVMDNQLVHMTDAYQNGRIVYLEHPNVWYTAEGGITALDIMLSDLESALLHAV